MIAAREIAVTQLTGARAWRVLYVSIGVDERTLLPVCGIVVAPDSAEGVSLHDGTADLLAWSHGTVGVAQDCQPSTDPAKDIFGPQADGLGAVSYGSSKAGNLHQGQPQNGVLQTAVNRGWTVSATDYHAAGLWRASPNTMPYLIGTMEGAEVLDSARAAAQVLADAYGPALEATSYDVLTWGWSQGGGSAFWAAQLGRAYYARTAPKHATPAMEVVGTAVVAPATNLAAVATDPQSTWGTHSIDRDMHERPPLALPIFASFVGAWNQWSRSPLASGAAFPAYPDGAANLDQAAILTPQGIQTTTQMLPECIQKQEKHVLPYIDPSKNAYFVQPIWGQPGTDGQYQGRMDETCNTTADAGIRQWCAWLDYNEPGPVGTSPFDKVPMAADGSLLPIFIGQGENDTAVHCVNTSTEVPAPADCLSRQFYDQLSAVYCPGGEAQAALELRLWLATPATPAAHSDIPGLASDNGSLAFTGSPLDTFMSAVFDGSGPASGCSAAVANP